jgi:hypothetical protein
MRLSADQQEDRFEYLVSDGDDGALFHHPGWRDTEASRLASKGESEQYDA